MKILVVGAGAIGGYYGGRLIEAGADVTFLVRQGRQRQLSDQGLNVVSELGNISVQNPKAVLSGDVSNDFDLIILACKAYDLDNVMEVIAPALSASTAILPLLNGVTAYNKLDNRFGRKRILGGVAYLDVSVDENSVVHQIGNNDLVIIGARTLVQTRFAMKFHQLLAKSVGRRIYSDTIEHDIWDKWVLVASGAAMTSLMRGSIQKILATSDGRRLMEKIIWECSSVATSSGFALRPDSNDAIRKFLFDSHSSWSASITRDIYQDSNRIESEALVGDMLFRANNLGVNAPMLRTAYCHLQVYEQHHC